MKAIDTAWSLAMAESKLSKSDFKEALVTIYYSSHISLNDTIRNWPHTALRCISFYKV